MGTTAESSNTKTRIHTQWGYSGAPRKIVCKNKYKIENNTYVTTYLVKLLSVAWITIDSNTFNALLPRHERGFLLAVVSALQSLTGIWAVHQKLTRTSWGLHQSYVVEVTRKAVILKESRGQHPQTQNHFFKTMTTFNTDYSNNELLDQELTIKELEGVAGGANETCRQVGDPKTGISHMVCGQYIG